MPVTLPIEACVSISLDHPANRNQDWPQGLSGGRKGLVSYHIGCRQPKTKQRIIAAATEGANGMRFLSPTCWTSTHLNLAARTCTAEESASRTAKTSAQLRPIHKKATVRILTSPPPIRFCE